MNGEIEGGSSFEERETQDTLDSYQAVKQPLRDQWDPFLTHTHTSSEDLDKAKGQLLEKIFKQTLSKSDPEADASVTRLDATPGQHRKGVPLWWVRGRHWWIQNKTRNAVSNTFEYPETSKLAWTINGIIVVSILVSTVTFCMESIPQFEDNQALEIIDYVCLAVFTIDYVTRLLTCPDLKKFFLSILNFIDLCAVLPFWIALIVEGPGASAADQTRILRVLRIVRVVRLLRIFPLFFNMSLVIDALVLSYGAILMLIFMLIIMLVVFASIIYYIESPTDNSVFYNIPQSMYFIQTTLTTTGYGEVVPITVGGKVVVGLMMICAVIILALPITIIGSNFSSIWAASKSRRRAAEKSPMIWSNFQTMLDLMKRQKAAIDDIMGLFGMLQRSIEQNVHQIRDLAHEARLIYLARAAKGKTAGWERDMASIQSLLLQMGDKIAESRDKYVEIQSLVQLSKVTRCENYAFKLNRMLEAYKHMNILFIDAARAVGNGKFLLVNWTSSPGKPLLGISSACSQACKAIP